MAERRKQAGNGLRRAAACTRSGGLRSADAHEQANEWMRSAYHCPSMDGANRSIAPPCVRNAGYRMDGGPGSAQVTAMSLILNHAAVIGNELALSFDGGFEAYLPLPMLRRACPCAACQGEPDALGRVVRPLVEHGPNAFQLLKFEQVGGYGIQLFWADGHSSGIYSYAYFQKLAELPPA